MGIARHRGTREDNPHSGPPQGARAPFNANPHAMQALSVPAGSPWHSGFVGTYHGGVEGQGYFSADATGGGSTDSLVVPFKGNQSMVGKRMAVLPSDGGSDVRKGAHAMSLDNSSDDLRSQYSHLPGYGK